MYRRHVLCTSATLLVVHNGLVALSRAKNRVCTDVREGDGNVCGLGGTSELVAGRGWMKEKDACVDVRSILVFDMGHGSSPEPRKTNQKKVISGAVLVPMHDRYKQAVQHQKQASVHARTSKWRGLMHRLAVGKQHFRREGHRALRSKISYSNQLLYGIRSSSCLDV